MQRLRALCSGYVARCFVIGGALWLVVAAIEGVGWIGDDARVVTVSDADLRQARQLVTTKTGRPPAPRPVEMALRQRIDEHILVAEALRLGLHRRDPIVRRRLVENMRVVYGDKTPRDVQLLREAEALNMPREDLLVRRRLIELMQRRFAGGHMVPDDDTLIAFIAEHPRRFAAADIRVDLEQRYFAGEDGEARARKALRALIDGAEVAGDPHLHGEAFRSIHDTDLQRLFGRDFAAAVAQLPAGNWQGPVRSAHGWHLLRIAERAAVEAPELDLVRRRAVYAWNEAQREVRVEQALAALRSEYRIVMEVTPVRLTGWPVVEGLR